jgi:hypothetical protein
VFLSALIRVFAVISNPISMVDNFCYTYAVLTELEERGVGLILRYKSKFPRGILIS